MSTSLQVVSEAVVFLTSTSRSAITCAAAHRHDLFAPRSMPADCISRNLAACPRLWHESCNRRFSGRQLRWFGAPRSGFRRRRNGTHDRDVAEEVGAVVDGADEADGAAADEAMAGAAGGDGGGHARRPEAARRAGPGGGGRRGFYALRSVFQIADHRADGNRVARVMNDLRSCPRQGAGRSTVALSLSISTRFSSLPTDWPSALTTCRSELPESIPLPREP